MGYWNHRVIQRKQVIFPDAPDEYTEISFGIVECYYHDNHDISGYTVNDIAPYGETVDELRESLERMLRALDRPILIDGEVPMPDHRFGATAEEMKTFRDFIIERNTAYVELDELPARAVDHFWNYFEEHDVDIRDGETVVPEYAGKKPSDLISACDVLNWVTAYLNDLETQEALNKEKDSNEH